MRLLGSVGVRLVSGKAGEVLGQFSEIGHLPKRVLEVQGHRLAGQVY